MCASGSEKYRINCAHTYSFVKSIKDYTYSYIQKNERERERERWDDRMSNENKEKTNARYTIYKSFSFFYQICLLKGKYTHTIITGLIKHTDLTNTHREIEREI